MESEFRAALVLLCRRVLHPLVRILVRFGISAGELKSIVDSVYADAGSEYLRRQGGRVTFSRLAVITGINRSFLPSLVRKPRDEFRPRSNTQLHRASRVLSGWYEDVHFQTSAGAPAPLPIRGRRRSFQKLVQRYSGGVYYPVVLSELLRAGAVRRIDGEHVRAVRRTLWPGGASGDFILAAGDSVGDLLATLEHNLTAKPHEQLPVRSLLLAADPRSLPLFRAQVSRRADAMLEAIDAFLEAHPPQPSVSEKADPAEPPMTLGAAVFAICRRPEELDSGVTLPGEREAKQTRRARPRGKT